MKIHHKVVHVAKRAVHHIKSFFKGFTIIELIVVIAIIAVLASIVLVNVSGYINKGKDSKVKADVSQITKSLLTFKTESGTYQGYTGVTGISAPCDEGTYTLNASTDAFIIYHKLCSTNKYWCSDSSGSLVQIDNAPSEGTYICSAEITNGNGGQEQEQGGLESKTVAGSPNPDCTGVYVEQQDNFFPPDTQTKTYKLTGKNWYLWYDGSFGGWYDGSNQWVISPTIFGFGIPAQWWGSGNSQINGTYQAQGMSTGNITVSNH